MVSNDQQWSTMVNNGQQWSQFLENQNLVGEDNDDPGVELGGEVSMWQKR